MPNEQRQYKGETTVLSIDGAGTTRCLMDHRPECKMQTYKTRSDPITLEESLDDLGFSNKFFYRTLKA